MRFLDADEFNLVDGNGRPCKRDIVQFVELNHYIEDGVIKGDSLAEAVFNEVPEQLVGHMLENGILAGGKGGNVDLNKEKEEITQQN